MLAQARADGLRVTAETCPHYLTLTADDVADGATAFKCCPPIRDEANREALWAGLADGLVDCVVSDHSPCTVDLKHTDTGDFAAAWGGIASVQLGLPVVWTAARARGYSLVDIATWMARRPAELAGLMQVLIEDGPARAAQIAALARIPAALQLPPGNATPSEAAARIVLGYARDGRRAA